ncbi:TCP-1/cpn60 chaperonin family protein [Methanolobus bombayensis]|uniref:TCP-1/cpn60 chaperonin family protein n=1 Tax=Methanolobus bombayensis TaxID=38023 RepID=UPI001AEAE2A7|nr:TCP-1/cpn60 chaperonin family protein [Methanolobus bombayensis]MBP1908956.1 chaperonin GroEL (HSP60 family) [Methanolobus bombayensis]
MSTSLENVQNIHSLDNMDALRQSVRNRIGIKDDVEEDELIYQMLQASNDIKDLFSTSFGPRGQSKIIISPTDDIYLTSDGKTIIEQIDVLHPVVTSLKELAISMDRVCGDGTKTSVILAATLIENAAKLMDYGLHPTTIIKGYQLALNKVYDILNYESTQIVSDDELYSVIENASLSKGVEPHQAGMIADIVLRTLSDIRELHVGNHIDLNEYIKVIKKVGGPSIESVNGIILDETPARPDMPDHLEDARVLMVNGNVKFESKIINSQRNLRIDCFDNSGLLLQGQKSNLKVMSRKLIDSGANIILCEGDVDEFVEESLAKKGILLFKKLKIRDMEMVGKATGASIISIRDDIVPYDLGLVNEVKVEKRNDEYFLFMSVNEQPISTIMIWEPFRYGLEKLEESVDDAINNAAFILKNPLVVKGGGDIEFVLSQMLRKYSSTIEGKEQLAVIEYANALEEIPRTLAKNVGLNEVDAITKMLTSYNEGIDSRIDLTRNVVQNYPPVYDSSSIKQMAVIAATEAVSNMLRIDKIVLKK